MQKFCNVEWDVENYHERRTGEDLEGGIVAYLKVSSWLSPL